MALNATADGGSAERISVAANATTFSFASQLTEGSGYSVTVVTQPSSPPQTCSPSNGFGTVGSANVTDVAVTCVTDSFSIGGTVSGLEGSGLILTLTDGATGSASRLSVAAGATSFLFGTTITSGHAYQITVDSAPVSPYQLCSISNGSGTIEGSDVSDVAVTCSTVTNSISGTFSGTVPSSAVITVTLSSGGSVIDTTTASASYGFSSVTAGITYTVTPSATGYVFDPGSAEVTLSGGNVTQGFAASCAVNYGRCELGCCPSVLALSGVNMHTCVLLPGQELKCWGDNFSGELGNGSSTDSWCPVSVVDGETYASVSAGEAHTCGVTSAGRVKCWGNNWHGQLGDNSTVSRNVPVLIADSSIGYSSVNAGGWDFSCGVTGDAGIKCWGGGAVGDLGNGTSFSSYAPVAVAGSSSYAFVALGYIHACAVTVDAGNVYCWGRNGYGQLGDGTVSARLSPVPVSDTASYSVVAAGEFHTCGIANGKVKCWGSNSAGQLGDGTTVDRYVPTSIVDSATTYSAIAAGSDHTCGLTATGIIKCWGSNATGQLGDNSSISRYVPATISGNISYAAVIAGLRYSCGVVADAGTVKCWGDNMNGKIGDGTNINRFLPVDVHF